MLIALLLIVRIEVVKSGPQAIEFIYRPEITIDNIECAPYYYPSEPGLPMVPYDYVVLGIPPGAQIDVKLLDTESRQFKHYIKPVPPIYGEPYNTLTSNQYYPSEPVELTKQGIFRDQHIAFIKLNFVQYNPATQTLRIHRMMRVKVTFVGGQPGNYKVDKMEPLYRALLLNYKTARSWRVPRKRVIPEKTTANWYKLRISHEGIYRITYQDLINAGIEPDFIDPRTIKIYAPPVGLRLSFSDTLVEIPIYVKSGITFDETSEIIFYAMGPHGWDKFPTTYLNPYSDYITYWLTWGGADGRRDSMVAPPTGETPPDRFTYTFHWEEDHLCPARGGLRWIWVELVRSPIEVENRWSYTFNLPELADSCGYLKVVFYRYWTDLTGENPSAQIHRVKLLLNDHVVSVDTIKGGSTSTPWVLEVPVTNLKTGENKFTILQWKTPKDTLEDRLYFDYFEVTADCKFESHNHGIKFETNEATDIHISGLDTYPYVFNVTDSYTPVRVVGGTFEGSIYKFHASPGVYMVTANPYSVEAIERSNPYSLYTDEDVDYAIITVREFIPYANRIAEWRTSHGIKTKVVPIDEIYDNFSFGYPHPDAIRRFIRYAYNNWGLCYVYLFGAGTYGYKEEVDRNRIPPYETGYLIGIFGYPPQGNKCYDDYFACINYDEDDIPDVVITRSTVKNEEEAHWLTEKVINYEQSHGGWRHRVLLIADDEYGQSICEPQHTSQVENSFTPLIPTGYDIYKVYLMNYQGVTQATDPNWTPANRPGNKPGVTEDILRYLHKGMFLAMWMGHGSIETIAHERVFVNPDDIYRLENNYKLPIFYFGACGVGCFDRLAKDGLGDYLEKWPHGGAIGVLASTRAASSTYNQNVGVRLLRSIFSDSVNRLGDAFLMAKLCPGGSYENYQGFGEPLIRIRLNNVDISTWCLHVPDTLYGGAEALIEGDGLPNGMVYITVLSSTYMHTHRLPDGGIITYTMRGAPPFTGYDNQYFPYPGRVDKEIIFEGIAPVVGGKFSVRFVTPAWPLLQPPMAGDNGKISLIWWDGTGGEATIGITGIVIQDTHVINDTVPPTIKLYVNGKQLRSGMEIPPSFTLYGVIEDSSGINIFDRTGPYAIRMSYDDPRFSDPIYLSDYFTYDLGSQTRGRFRYKVDVPAALSDFTLYFSAADNICNVRVDSFHVTVMWEQPLDITELRVYPNPVRGDKVTFYFYLTKESTVWIRIYTITGRVIQVLGPFDLSAGYNEIEWDTCDFIGDKIGSGIYFYKVVAIREEPGQRLTTSKLDKFLVIR